VFVQTSTFVPGRPTFSCRKPPAPHAVKHFFILRHGEFTGCRNWLDLSPRQGCGAESLLLWGVDDERGLLLNRYRMRRVVVMVSSRKVADHGLLTDIIPIIRNMSLCLSGTNTWTSPT
jgi:hypothetical protein